MQWKFWKSKRSQGTNGSNGNTAEKNSRREPRLPLAGSQKELLALQRTIGNQAVLQLLMPEAKQDETEKPWRKKRLWRN